MCVCFLKNTEHDFTGEVLSVSWAGVKKAVRVLTGLRVTEIGESHGVELSSVCYGSVQQTAATPRVTAQTHTDKTKLSSGVFKLNFKV